MYIYYIYIILVLKGLGGRFWPFAHFLQIHQLLFGRFSAFNDPPSDPYIISNDFYCFIWSSFMRGFHWYAFCTYLGWFRGSYSMLTLLNISESIWGCIGTFGHQPFYWRIWPEINSLMFWGVNMIYDPQKELIWPRNQLNISWSNITWCFELIKV